MVSHYIIILVLKQCSYFSIIVLFALHVLIITPQIGEGKEPYLPNASRHVTIATTRESDVTTETTRDSDEMGDDALAVLCEQAGLKNHHLLS